MLSYGCFRYTNRTHRNFVGYLKLHAKRTKIEKTIEDGLKRKTKRKNEIKSKHNMGNSRRTSDRINKNI